MVETLNDWEIGELVGDRAYFEPRQHGLQAPQGPRHPCSPHFSGILAGRVFPLPATQKTHYHRLRLKRRHGSLQVRNKEMQGAMTLFHQSRHIRTPSLGSAH